VNPPLRPCTLSSMMDRYAAPSEVFLRILAVTLRVEAAPARRLDCILSSTTVLFFELRIAGLPTGSNGFARLRFRASRFALILMHSAGLQAVLCEQL